MKPFVGKSSDSHGWYARKGICSRFFPTWRQAIEWALLALILAGSCFGQSPLGNFAAVGVSYQPAGKVAGTGLYARLFVGGTYAFTVVDAVPQTSQKPYNVATSYGAGVAQKLFTLKVGSMDVPIFVPTSAGISHSGDATGWAWSTGGLAVIPLGKDTAWRLMPNVRVLKSNVSGDGYGVVAGVLVGWGW